MDSTAGQGDEDRLYGLVEVTDRQQAAVQTALDGLATERAALAREREALARQVQALQSGVQGAARAAVAEGLAGAGVEGVALVLLGWLASALVLWWDAGAIGAARVERRQLQLEIAELRASRDEWVKTGAQAKLERCGPKGRLCVRVDERAGVFGTESDHLVLLGY